MAACSLHTTEKEATVSCRYQGVEAEYQQQPQSHSQAAWPLEAE